MKIRTGDLVLFNDRKHGIRSAIRQLIYGRHYSNYGIVVGSVYGEPLMLTNDGPRWRFLPQIVLSDFSDVMVLRPSDVDETDVEIALHAVLTAAGGIRIGRWSGLWFALKQIVEVFSDQPVRKKFRFFPPIADSPYTLLYMYVFYSMIHATESPSVLALVDELMQYDAGSFCVRDLERHIFLDDWEPWMLNKPGTVETEEFTILFNKYENKVWLNQLSASR